MEKDKRREKQRKTFAKNTFSITFATCVIFFRCSSRPRCF